MNTAQISLFGSEEEVIVNKKRLKKENTDKKIIEAKDKEIKELKNKIFELEHQGEEQATIEYLNVDKKCHCSKKKFSLTYRQLEELVDMAFDYCNILQEKISKFDENKAYAKATFNLKRKNLMETGNKIAEEIKYSKSCSNVKKDRGDIGGDAFELLVNGFDH